MPSSPTRRGNVIEGTAPRQAPPPPVGARKPAGGSPKPAQKD